MLSSRSSWLHLPVCQEQKWGGAVCRSSPGWTLDTFSPVWEICIYIYRPRWSGQILIHPQHDSTDPICIVSTAWVMMMTQCATENSRLPLRQQFTFFCGQLPPVIMHYVAQQKLHTDSIKQASDFDFKRPVHSNWVPLAWDETFTACNWQAIHVETERGLKGSLCYLVNLMETGRKVCEKKGH